MGMEIGYETKITLADALAPSGSVADFHSLVSDLSVHENVLIVGHNPNLQQFLSSLISCASANGHGAPERASIRLRKGALARVDCTRRPSTLNWLLDARMLRTLYSSVTKSSRLKTSKK
ncbi:Phosphohistidine phosphatase SixA [Acidisarcina polymorpha]|uniref:Phosphohistidine phosphatase SixA n=1 Tax=Acidisarcina polymorpha TaxID=2211140 RepID=A0A2Z5G723_9BACT|nr:Phosphohistidine phosphatase SixA [Acidisarcina polymorpha]